MISRGHKILKKFCLNMVYGNKTIKQNISFKYDNLNNRKC